MVHDMMGSVYIMRILRDPFVVVVEEVVPIVVEFGTRPFDVYVC